MYTWVQGTNFDLEIESYSILFSKMRKTGGLLAQGLFQRRWPVTPMTCNIDDP